MRNETADWSELVSLSTTTLCQLYLARHELADNGLGAKIESLLWDRRGLHLDAWPSYYYHSELLPKWMDLHYLGRNHVVAFCRHAKDDRDPEHRPTMRLNVPAIANMSKYRCSCGWAGQLYEMKRRQRYGTAKVWPTEAHPTARRNDGVPVRVMLVCPLAENADDPEHAPDSSGMRCICGHGLDERWFPDDKTLQRLPVQ